VSVLSHGAPQGKGKRLVQQKRLVAETLSNQFQGKLLDERAIDWLPQGDPKDLGSTVHVQRFKRRLHDLKGIPPIPHHHGRYRAR